MTFGRNFTKMLDFYGEGEQWKQGNVEKYTSEEEFYYFDRNVKLIIIDVSNEKMGNIQNGGKSIEDAQNYNGSRFEIDLDS